MSVLSRLFRQEPPPTQEKSEPLAALPSQSPESLARIALGDADEVLRIAAVKLLGAADILIQLAGVTDGAATPAPIRRAARLRLGELLDAGAISPDELRQRAGSTAAALAIAGNATNPVLVEQLMTTVTDPEQLAELALNGATPAVRQLAADRVQDAATIGRLLKDARGKDKNVYRILKAKRDAQHAQQRAIAESLAAMTTLCGTIEHHSHQPFTSVYAAAVDHLDRQWHELATQAPAELQRRATIALDRCREIVDRHRQEVAAEAAHAAALQQAGAARSTLLQSLPALLASLFDGDAADAGVQLAAHTAHWDELAAVQPPTREQLAAFGQLTHAIAALTAFNAQHGSVAQLAATLDANTVAPLRQALVHLEQLGERVPESASAALAALQAWEQARAAEAESAAAALRQVTGLLRKAQGALAAGQSRQAAGMRRALEDKLTDVGVLPAHVANQLQSFDERLGALQDWRSFAVAPKRIELIEQMEALIGAEEAPTALADRIKRLQEEWKLISKGNTEDTQAEWQRFHDAAQRAYEPCREFFSAQALLRDGNLEKRAALLARLQTFVDSQNPDHPDWREIARALRESRLQWRSLQPVERAANKPLQERFEALTAGLQSRLDAEYARNIEAKRALIARAQRLATADDGRQAAEEVKGLQQAWKDIGLVPQDVSQSLWEEFRQHCDAVFANRQQQHTEFAAQLATNGTRAAELCLEVEQLATLSGQELVEAVRRVPALRESFAAIGELPRADAHALRSRLERALSRCEQRLAEQRASDRAKAWEHVFEAGDRIRRFRQAAVQGASPDEVAALRLAAQACIDATPLWPKGMQRTLGAELARDASPDVTANELQLRLLCIRAEQLTGIATPEADQALRRDWQLQQLTQGLGQANPSNNTPIEALIHEWLSVGATSDAVHGELLTRFMHCCHSTQGNLKSGT